jgi:CubicO group peptidase (beta-lactamase class C family)
LSTLTTFSPSGIDQLRGTMNGYIERGDIAGVVVLLSHRGETWIESLGARDLESGVPMSPDTIFRIASMTKAVLATATMQLVEEGQLDLDVPVDQWLPELANRQVVRDINGPLDETVPAVRPITTRHLLTLTWGLGALMGGEGASPLGEAIAIAGLSPSALQPAMTPDQWMAALEALPLAHQPGEGWMYHTGFDVLAVLLARVTGTPLADLLQERLFDPLGMIDTGFFTPPASIERLATAYRAGENGLVVSDPARDGGWSQPPLFPSELVSTANDYLAFARMLLAEGDAPTGRLLSQASVREMTRDQITPDIKRDFPFFPGFWDTSGWGYGVSPLTGTGVESNGSYGWSGGFNTHWRNDPANDLVGLLLTQQEMGGPAAATLVDDYWRLVYQGLDT